MHPAFYLMGLYAVQAEGHAKEQEDKKFMRRLRRKK